MLAKLLTSIIKGMFFFSFFVMYFKFSFLHFLVGFLDLGLNCEKKNLQKNETEEKLFFYGIKK